MFHFLFLTSNLSQDFVIVVMERRMDGGAKRSFQTMFGF